MHNLTDSIVTPDPWQGLKKFTEARIALGRTGISLPLQEYLQFKLAHAKARDAVHKPVDISDIGAALETLHRPFQLLRSKINSRQEYLTRPDKGRILDKPSREVLQEKKGDYDVCIVICDGLSAPAVNDNAVPVANGLLDIIDQTTLTAAPVCLVSNGRVAIGDEVGSLLGAQMVVILIGERPGLSSPNSLGAYLTFRPQPGLTDEARNCISNIRNGGLTVSEAVRKAAYLIEKAFELGETGVRLKDKMDSKYVPLLSYKAA